MIITNNKNYRDDFVAIVEFIKTEKEKIDLFDLMNFIATFKYFKVYYQNYHIFKDLIKFHDDNLGKLKPDQDYTESQNLDDLLNF